MKLIINEHCFGTNISTDKKIDKKVILNRVINKFNRREEIDFFIELLSHYIKPSLYETNVCSKCGSSNAYIEYELDE